MVWDTLDHKVLSNTLVNWKTILSGTIMKLIGRMPNAMCKTLIKAKGYLDSLHNSICVIV